MDTHINYWRYALEIEKAGSIRKAADNLFMGQPNLSRALSELEESIGIRIFERSSQGVKPTIEGAEFLICARSVLRHIADVEKQFHPDLKAVQTMHIQVPRSGYVSQALASILQQTDPTQTLDIQFEEAVSTQSIQSLLRAQINLAIVRFHHSELNYYLNLFKEHSVHYNEIWEYDYVVTLSENDPLATKERLVHEDLVNYREIVHAHRTANLFLPEYDSSGSTGQLIKQEKIYVNDRSNQLFLIRNVPHAFMWGAPSCTTCMENDGLIQIPFESDALHYHEGVIRRHNYRLSMLEKSFIKCVEDLVQNDQACRINLKSNDFK